MGDDQPSPGNSVFHAMFWRSVQLIGSCFSTECPCALTPRKLDQFSARNRLQHEVSIRHRKKCDERKCIGDARVETDELGGEGIGPTHSLVRPAIWMTL